MRFCVCLFVLSLVFLAGCRERPVAPPVKDPEPPVVAPEVPNTPDPLPLLERMVLAYQSATSYSDRATLQIIGRMSPPQSEPASWDCVVVLQKSNKLRLEICEGIFVADGEDCFAQIRLLPDQVLHFPAPESWTLETLFHDVHMSDAMELAGLPQSVLCFPPQLVLLFANNPLNTFCPRGAKVEWLEQQPLGAVQCDVIRISHSDGNRILWISRENSILLRLDYQPVGLPVPEGFESIEAIRIEMTDAQFGGDFAPETFQMLQPQDAVRVAQFQSDIQGLPSPEEHHRRLKLMSERDCYRQIDHHVETPAPSENIPPPKGAPETFSLVKEWSQPLLGVSTMALLPGAAPQLIVPYEGNRAAVLDLQGKILNNYSPKGLEESIIMNIRCNVLSDKRRIGILTLDGKFHLFDESFQPIAAQDVGTDKNKAETIRDFTFVPFAGYGNHEEALLLAIQQGSEEDNAPVNCVIRAVDLQGIKIWERLFKGMGMPHQISPATMDNQPCALVSCTAAQNHFLAAALDEESESLVEVPPGRHVIWFHVLDSTIYTLRENTDTGDIHFVGLNEQGKGKWSRLLPPGEYEVEPVYLPKEKKWFIPSPGTEIAVIDQIGNMIDTFSLGIVPTGMISVEVGETTLLIVADGETVSAWKLGPAQPPLKLP